MKKLELMEKINHEISEMDDKMAEISKRHKAEMDEAVETAKNNIEVLVKGWTKGDFVDYLDGDVDDNRQIVMVAEALKNVGDIDEKTKEDLDDFIHSIISHTIIDEIADALFGPMKKSDKN